MPARTRPALPPFEHVVDAHGAALLRFCVARVGAVRAEDCFQETMLAALRAYPSLRDPQAVRGWLFAIAARKVLDALRDGARAPRAEADVERLAPAAPAALRDPALWARVARLPAKQREAVTLRHVADLSHREIAAIMATSEAAARRNVFEGLARLRREAAAAAPSARSHGSRRRAVSRT